MIRELLHKLYISDDTPLITYEQLKESNPFERVRGSEGIHFERIPLREETSILYRTDMADGSNFSTHYHDCKEVVSVRQGVAVFRGRDYLQGESFTVQAFVPHEVSAKGHTILYVEFIRP